MQNGRVDAHAHARVSLLDTAERASRREGTLGQQAHRQIAPQTCLADVDAKFPDGSTRGDGRIVRCWHDGFIHEHYSQLSYHEAPINGSLASARCVSS